MRKIKKQPEAPECLTEFIELEQQSGPPVVNLCYEEFKNPGKAQFLKALTREQHGICGYTGAPVDARIGGLVSPEEKVTFSNHIEHLKCREACKTEIESRGLEHGRDLGEDHSYFNMIAALEIRGAEKEHFGAVYKDNKELPVWPLHDGCEERFRFNKVDGSVSGLDDDADASVRVLKLNHTTLKEWRKVAIDAFLDPAIISSREDFEAALEAVENPRDGRLPEFSFSIASVAKQYLQL